MSEELILPLTEFFKWMTITGIGILLFSTLMVVILKNSMKSLHAKLFGVSEDQISVMIYGYLAGLKIMVLIFTLTPYLALLLMQQ